MNEKSISTLLGQGVILLSTVLIMAACSSRAPKLAQPESASSKIAPAPVVDAGPSLVAPLTVLAPSKMPGEDVNLLFSEGGGFEIVFCHSSGQSQDEESGYSEGECQKGIQAVEIPGSGKFSALQRSAWNEARDSPVSFYELSPLGAKPQSGWWMFGVGVSPPVGTGFVTTAYAANRQHTWMCGAKQCGERSYKPAGPSVQIKGPELESLMTAIRKERGSTVPLESVALVEVIGAQLDDDDEIERLYQVASTQPEGYPTVFTRDNGVVYSSMMDIHFGVLGALDADADGKVELFTVGNYSEGTEFNILHWDSAGHNWGSYVTYYDGA